jgi:ubiquitin-like 1-activating enzyme E1 B
MSNLVQPRDRGIGKSLGGALLQRVKKSRVLLVGAGGIGCELLKNLVCCGFASDSIPHVPTNDATGGNNAHNAPQRKAEVVVIDLDTIDLSNLNRQFLFRKQHIKKPKAYVAKETARQFNPAVNIEAHHASIFDSQYDVDFFESFDVVFNALDNLAARRHVNKMCLAADVPLIESGTTGFNGQVQAIKKGVTECYDCNPKPIQKSFPICTIRSTPSQPIHCIVWAKSYLFPELFGSSEEESTDVVMTDGDDAEEVAKLKLEAEALKNIRSMMGTSEFAAAVFNKVFHDDIERLRSMAEMWKSRKPPSPLKFDGETDSSNFTRGEQLATQDQKTWSLLENIAVFCYSLSTLSRRVEAGEKVIEFDKDDKDTLDFVASAANLRAHVFDMPLHSEWEIKQMAGNIIPAIATSNALTASLCVFEAFKILRPQQPAASANNSAASRNAVNTKEDSLLGGSKMVFLQSKSTERLITSEPLGAPKPDCPVCSPVYAKLLLPTGTAPTLQDLVDVLKERIGYEEFSITTDAGILYDPDLDDNLLKPLSELKIVTDGNIFITIMDDADEAKADLILSVKGQSAPAEEAEVRQLQLLPKNIILPAKPPKSESDQDNGETNGQPAPIEPILDAAGAGRKRKREAEDDFENSAKKRKSEVYVVEDDGSILLDD